MRSAPGEIGRGLAISFSRTAFGTVSAFSQRATPNSSARLRPPAADNRPVYGAFFWLNGDGRYPVPRDAYYMLGAGGQTTLMIPSHDLVVVRLGHYRGESAGAAGFRKALALLIEAVPKAQNEAIHPAI